MSEWMMGIAFCISSSKNRGDTGWRMLGVYFEQNATTEKYEDYDGERWIILND